MEIEINNVYYNQLNDFSLRIKRNQINCIIGDESKGSILDLLIKDAEYDGSITNMNNMEISYVSNNLVFRYKSISLEFSSYLESIGYKKESIAKRVNESLKIVGLEDKKNKFIDDLSYGEKILLRLAMALASKFDLLIIDNIFDYLDKDAKNMIANMTTMLRGKYKKTIVIITNDVDYIYPFGTYYHVIKSGKTLISGDESIFYNSFDVLRSSNIDVPNIVKFTKIAKDRKSVKLHIRNNIKDLMKDIYRSV